MNTPTGTYRIQLNGTFTLSDAAELVQYMDDLGISHIYASPVFAARSGSMHGYDMIDFRKINTEIGGNVRLTETTEKFHERGIGWIQDFVPNHMAYTPENPFVRDVMVKGAGSEYSRYFDIIWFRHSDPHPGRICAPFLGSTLEESVRQGDLRLGSGEEDSLEYYSSSFPVSEDSRRALKDRFGRSGAREEIGEDDLLALAGLQHYRLEHWKNSFREINYRRFFSINELIALRVEDSEVFRDVHSEILGMIDSGIIDGIRVDHVDGLADPESYLATLSDHRRAYIIVEKILAQEERLPASWKCRGTTGYDFLGMVGSAFVNEDSESDFNDGYRAFQGSADTYVEQARKIKEQKLMEEFSGDLDNATDDLVAEMHGQSGRSVVVQRERAREVLKEIIANLGVYRTYLNQSGETGQESTERIRNALKDATERDPELKNVAGIILEMIENGEVDRRSFTRVEQLSSAIMAKAVEDTMFFRYNRLISLNEVGSDPAKFGISVDRFHSFMEGRARDWPLTMNSTSTHDTKIGEDARARISCLSEVPGEWFQSVRRWSGLNKGRRSNDSEVAPDPNEEYYLYQIMVGTWNCGDYPEAGTAERLRRQMMKALREAGVNTSWASPDDAYEDHVGEFISRILDPAVSQEFLRSFSEFAEKVSYYGASSSISQLILKMTCPGVPDIYQGSELWNFSLTDPDNRRHVDFASRRRIMMEIKDHDNEPGYPGELLERYYDGKVKMLVTKNILNARKELPDLFLHGTYSGIGASGSRAGNLIAFTRKKDGNVLLVAVPRFLSQLSGQGKGRMMGMEWDDTGLDMPFDIWEARDVITGRRYGNIGKGRIDPSMIMRDFPAAVIRGEYSEQA